MVDFRCVELQQLRFPGLKSDLSKASSSAESLKLEVEMIKRNNQEENERSRIAEAKKSAELEARMSELTAKNKVRFLKVVFHLCL